MRESKIDKWGLGDFVLEKKKDGKSDMAIAKAIQLKYCDIEELSDLSDMAVNRWLSKHDEEEMKKKLDVVKDPTKLIQQEYNNKMRESIQDTETARKTIEKYMNELKSGECSASDVQKIIASWQKINDQYRKNLVSLREFTDHRIIKPTQNIIYKKETNMKNVILDFSRCLCPECRKRVKEEIKILKEET